MRGWQRLILGRAAGTAAGRGSLLALGFAALVLLVCLAWAGRGDELAGRQL